MSRYVWLSLVLISVVSCTLKEADDSTASARPPSDVAAPPRDALKTPSGLASKMLRVGLGRDHPGPRSQVLVNYTGWTPDGKMIDSSFKGGGPLLLRVDQVIPGWTEGLQLMVPGEKRRFWIPGRLAYDNIDMPNMPKGDLVFDIELLEIR
jgi:FKBP-type peptidyl-prolyl cis-trans isomerase